MTNLSPDKLADLRVKQLEMVQAIIARLANYGATLKNYCITLTTAVCGFSVTLRQPLVALLALLPIVLFALLDAQFLRNERRFRQLFNRLADDDWSSEPRFAIDLRSAPRMGYCSILVSWSILVFYLPLAAAVAVVVIITGHAYGLLF